MHRLGVIPHAGGLATDVIRLGLLPKSNCSGIHSLNIIVVIIDVRDKEERGKTKDRSSRATVDHAESGGGGGTDCSIPNALRAGWRRIVERK